MEILLKSRDLEGEGKGEREEGEEEEVGFIFFGLDHFSDIFKL